MPKLVDVIIVNRVRLPETLIFYMILEGLSRFDPRTADRARAVGKGRGGVNLSPRTGKLGFRTSALHASRHKASADTRQLEINHYLARINRDLSHIMS